MKADIYKKKTQKKGSVIKYYPVDEQKVDGVDEVRDEIAALTKKLSEIEQGIKAPVVKVNLPDVQDVKVTNPTPPTKVQFPEVQKVEVTNPTPPIAPPEVQKVEVQNPAAPIVFPEVQRVALEKPIEIPQIPMGKGDIPGKADPETYVPVRLTDGKKFYSAQRDAYVAAAKQSFPFVDVNGKPKQVQLDSDGNLPTSANASITTTSGSPLYVFPVNEPTVRQVFVTNPSSATVTTTSGSPLDVTVRNLPTVQTVAVQTLPYVRIEPGVTTAVSGNVNITTTSGSPLDTRIINFPTIYTVRTQEPLTTARNWTLASGTDALQIANFPTIQTVQGSLGRSWTLTSGTDALAISNFPTKQTVVVESMPLVTVTGTQTVLQGTSPWVTSRNWTLASGTDNTSIANFPTVQTVNVLNIPAVGRSWTLASGTDAVQVANFPTIQTVRTQEPLQTSRSWTLASGTDALGISNFPTVQTVSVKDLPYVQIQPGVTTAVSGSLSLTTASGTPMYSNITNFPTTQTVNQGQDPWMIAVKAGFTTAVSGTIAVRNDSLGTTLTSNDGDPSRVAVDNKGALFARLFDGITGSLATIRTPADALQDSSIGLVTNAFGFVYNGGTWDKIREVVNGQDSTGTGILANGILAQYDDVSPGTVTENRFAPLRMSSRRAMYVEAAPGVTTAVSGSLSLVTTSGSPMNAFITNLPTVQTVNVQNIPAIGRTWTLTSGTDSTSIANFPTVQSVNVLNIPTVTVTGSLGRSWTLASGTDALGISNFPTVQTVNVQNIPSVGRTWTLASGTDAVSIANFPTIQTVRTQEPLSTSRTWTLTSGSDNTAITNFPTVQTVNVMNMPAVTGSLGRTWTLASGTDSAAISNFPTVQTVNVMNIPSVGRTWTLASGTDAAAISNFPTVQSVKVEQQVYGASKLGVTKGSKTGTTTTTSGIVAALPGKYIRVTAYSLITGSATDNTVTFKDLPGNSLWGTELQAIASSKFGANLATQAPDYLFTTTSGSLLELNLSAAAAVRYSISYFYEDV